MHLVVGGNALAAARCARALEVGARPKLIAPVPVPPGFAPSPYTTAAATARATAAKTGVTTAAVGASSDPITTTTTTATVLNNGGGVISGDGGGNDGGGDGDPSSSASCSFLPPSLQQRISDGRVEWFRRGFADDDVRTLGREAVGGVVDAVFVTLGRDEEALSMWFFFFLLSILLLFPFLFFPKSFRGITLFFAR